MMANPPVMQKNGFASAIGTGKPAAAMEGMGTDFLALLESLGAMPAEEGTQADAVGVNAFVGAGELSGTVAGAVAAPVQPTAQEDAVPEPTLPIPEPTLAAPDSLMAQMPAGAIPADKALARSAAARLAETASSLPHVTQAMSSPADQPQAKDASKLGEKDEKAEKTGGKGAAPAQTQGLAMALLQTVEAVAPSLANAATGKDMKPVAAAPADPQAAALRAFALPFSALRQAGALPDQAAAPAGQQALERLAQARPLDVSASAMPVMAQAPEKASTSSASHPTPKLEQPVMSSAVAAAGIDGSPVPSGKGQPVKDQAAEAAAAPAASSAPAPAIPQAAVPAAQALPADLAVAAPAPAPALSVPVADMAALLGEQVIDMGVDGQWIDRMAREIADISAGTGRAFFTLNPENLGRLQVEILQRDEGADVRLIAESDEAVSVLNQGRHQLQQDSRLQAARINDVQIERGSQNSDNAPVARGNAGQELFQQQGQQQSQAFHKKPLIESVSSMARGEEPGEEADSAAASRNARYA